MSAMTDDAVGFEPDAGLVPTEAKIARQEMLRQLLRSKTFIVGVVVVLFWVFWALTGSAFTPHDPLEQTDAILKAPDSTYWFGTDQFGRDIFSRVLAGAQSTLRVAPAATVIAITLGTILGLIMGFVGGFTDEAMSRLVDAILALPLIVIAVVVLTALGSSNITLILVIGLIFTSPIARTVRATVLGERQLDYVQAAQLRGERGPYIMFVEILPNIMGPIIVETTVRLGYAIFAIAGLDVPRFRSSAAVARLVAPDLRELHAAQCRHLLVDGALRVSCDHDARDRRQPRRRRAPAGGGRMSEAIGEDDRAPHALELDDLDVVYRVRGTDRQVLRGVTLNVKRGEAYGLVGESGCGKSTAALAIVNYLPRNGRVRSGGIKIDGRDALSLSTSELRELRSTAVSMVYQNPGAALNPSIRVGKQVAEVFRVRGASASDATAKAQEALERVQIADTGSVMGRYAHQLSGGMQQRVVIAMALATDPALLILDEPTTGLDATVEAEVLDLVAGLQAELRTSVLFISHNLGIIKKMCDRVGVLYAGCLVEEGETDTILADPRHPYTVGLLRCVPRGGVRKDHGRLDTIPGFMPNVGEELPGCVFAGRCTLAVDRCRTEVPEAHAIGGSHMSRCHFHEQAQSLPREMGADLALPAVDRAAAPLLSFDDLGKVFKQQGHEVHALVGVTAAIWPGETLGLVGESGSGKTTLARSLLGLVAPDHGCGQLRRPGALGNAEGPDAGGHARVADRVPESGLGAQPSAHGAKDHAPLAEEAGRNHRVGCRGPNARADELRAARGTLRQCSTGPVVRWPEAAPGDSPVVRR